MHQEISQAFAEILDALPLDMCETERHRVIGALQVLSYYLSAENELIVAVTAKRQDSDVGRDSTLDTDGLGERKA